MPIRITGMNSGLDTEAIVSAMVMNKREKVNKLKKKQTALSWKQDAWKSVNTQVNSLFTKVSAMRFSSAYVMNKTTVSNTNKARVTAGADAMAGSQDLKITSLAKTGYLTGAKLEGSTANTTLADLKFTAGEGTIDVNTANGTKQIKVTAGMKISEFVDKLKDAGVKANYDAANKRIFVGASDSGKDNDFSLTGADEAGLSAIAAFGLNAAPGQGGQISSAYTTLNAYAVTTDGVYDAEATKANIKSILDQISAAYSTKTEKSAENTVLNKEIEYANAYQTEKNALNDTTPGNAQLNQIFNLIDTYEDRGKYISADGNTVYDGVDENEDGTFTYYKLDENGEKTDQLTVAEEDKLKTIEEKITELGKAGGFITEELDDEGNVKSTDRKALDQLIAAHNTVKAYEENDENADEVAAVHSQYSAGDAEAYRAFVTGLETQVNDNIGAIADADNVIKDYKVFDQGSDTSKYTDELAETLEKKVAVANKAVNGGLTYNSDAKRVDAEDAEIYLNGVRFTSATNSITVNGLTIEALETTGTKDDAGITVTTTSDSQGLYDKIKDFFSEYNNIINSLVKQYNAASAKGYEPLTDEEKAEMSDTEVEKWEQKIKDASLRRDGDLNTIINTITSAMYKSFTVDGQKYSLSSFGIATMGLGSAENEQYAYHIDGDSDDSLTSGKKDKLMTALQNDPDAVIDFMKQLSENLHSTMDKTMMRRTTLRSANTVYNDKQMKKEYDSYTKEIKSWEEKVEDMETRYFKQFSAMEKALANLQSNTSAISGLLGG